MFVSLSPCKGSGELGNFLWRNCGNVTLGTLLQLPTFSCWVRVSETQHGAAHSPGGWASSCFPAWFVLGTAQTPLRNSIICLAKVAEPTTQRTPELFGLKGNLKISCHGQEHLHYPKFFQALSNLGLLEMNLKGI